MKVVFDVMDIYCFSSFQSIILLTALVLNQKQKMRAGTLMSVAHLQTYATHQSDFMSRKCFVLTDKRS